MKERTLVKQSPIKPTYTHWSILNDRAFYIDSSLELDFARLLEFTNELKSYAAQPPPLFYSLKGRERRYTPDFEVITNSAEIIVEIKPQDEALTTDLMKKWALLTELYAEEGKQFKVFTEREIRVGERASNLDLLYPWRFHPAPLEAMERIIREAARIETLEEFDQAVLRLNLDVSVPVLAMAHGLVECDLTLSITDAFPLALISNDHKPLCGGL